LLLGRKGGIDTQINEKYLYWKDTHFDSALNFLSSIASLHRKILDSKNFSTCVIPNTSE
jgi:hypothetical protein